MSSETAASRLIRQEGFLHLAPGGVGHVSTLPPYRAPFSPGPFLVTYLRDLAERRK